ncbi:MAG TPA: MOSC domain-containing protein [Opitutus sp.]|nr:MOSC domain-containing protein [Opitutus sp.]
MNLTIDHIYVSPGHSFVGRHGQDPADQPMCEVETVECVAGSGLRGDRYFNHRDDYKGQVTLFAAEVFEKMQAELGAADAVPSAMRRNVIVRGRDLNELVGQEFELQGVRLIGTEECRPCYWMDRAVAPGAEAWLRGRGGLRCRVLTSGWLRRDGA